MIELLFGIAILLFVIGAVRVWRKHVLKRPRSLQQSFDDFLREEKARRTERG